MKYLFQNIFTPIAAIVTSIALHVLLMATSLAGDPTPEQQSGGDINKIIYDGTKQEATLESSIEKAAEIIKSGDGQGLLGRSIHLEKEAGKKDDTGPRKYQGTYKVPALPKDKQSGYLIGLAVFSDDGCNVATKQTIDNKSTYKQVLLKQGFKPQSLPTVAAINPAIKY